MDKDYGQVTLMLAGPYKSSWERIFLRYELVDKQDPRMTGSAECPFTPSDALKKQLWDEVIDTIKKREKIAG